MNTQIARNFKVSVTFRPARRVVYGKRTYTYIDWQVLPQAAEAHALYAELRRKYAGSRRVHVTMMATAEAPTNDWQTRRFR